MARAREGDVAEAATFPIPALKEWARALGTTSYMMARYGGVTPGMLLAVHQERSRIRGAAINRMAHVLGVPASILVRCGPFDEEGRPWARRAALAEMRRRLTPAS
ncbi:MAG: hypothetical protein IVW57_04450 [Ktedonobacterales bacterium]|nr:hypothetical protein [Ktedonobacterales bacterium]